MFRSGRASLFAAVLCFAALVGTAALPGADGNAGRATWPACPAPTYWPEELRTKLPVNVCGPGKVIPSVEYS